MNGNHDGVTGRKTTRTCGNSTYKCYLNEAASTLRALVKTKSATVFVDNRIIEKIIILCEKTHSHLTFVSSYSESHSTNSRTQSVRSPSKNCHILLSLVPHITPRPEASYVRHEQNHSHLTSNKKMRSRAKRLTKDGSVVSCDDDIDTIFDSYERLEVLP